MRTTLIALTLVACTNGTTDATEDSETDSQPEPLSVVGFNVESGGAFDDVVAETIARVQGEGLWGTTETMNTYWVDKFAAAAADDGVAFASVMGTTGYQDRIAILWDDQQYELLSSEELHDINVGDTGRAPLVGHFRTRASGIEFKFMVNHLWRSEEGYRHEQARRLKTWGGQQTLPVIAVGDYNFDWVVEGGDTDHDAGYDLMTEGGVWQWVRPDPLIRTQCSNFYDSVLDFVFVAGDAQNWAGVSDVLEPQNSYCPDTPQTSDHRPVRGDFLIP